MRLIGVAQWFPCLASAGPPFPQFCPRFHCFSLVHQHVRPESLFPHHLQCPSACLYAFPIISRRSGPSSCKSGVAVHPRPSERDPIHLHFLLSLCARSLDISMWRSGFPAPRLLALHFLDFVLVFITFHSFTNMSPDPRSPASPVLRPVVLPCISHCFPSFWPFQLQTRCRCASSTGPPPFHLSAFLALIVCTIMRLIGLVQWLPCPALLCHPLPRFCPRFGPFSQLHQHVSPKSLFSYRLQCAP